MTGTAVHRMSARVATGAVVAYLVGMDVAQHVLHVRWRVRPVEAAALVGLARLEGLTWVQAGATDDGVASAAGGSHVVLVLGTVSLTTVGGLVFGELRRRSGSVLAAAGAHGATNGLGVLFGVVLRRVAG